MRRTSTSRTSIALLLLATVATACSSSTTDPVPRVPSPGELPLLGPGPRVGVIYSTPAPAAQATLDAAFAGAIAAGADTYELALSWAALETSPGVIDTALLDTLLGQISGSGLVPYLNVTTIDTVQLNLPADFVDPMDSTELATGVTFADPALSARFRTLLDAVVPRLVAHGGFYLAIGNEVDAWLGARPAAVADYLTFLTAARAYARTLDDELAIGVAVQYGILATQPILFADLRVATDAVAFTYYPLNPDFSVQSPLVVPVDFAAMLAAVDPDPLLLQEVGYPAGYAMNGMLGSTQAQQMEFVDAVFAEIAASPRIRFVSFLHLADWSPAELDLFELYYGLTDPRFREYLGTLGMREHADGAAKAAWAAFIAGLSGI